MIEINSDELYVNSTFVENRPMVYWRYQGQSGLLTVNEARSRADVIFQAAGIAESEAAIVQGFRAIEKRSGRSKPKGFGQPQASENDIMIAQLLAMIREHRPEFPKEIKVIFGFHTQQALVEMYWYGTRIQEAPEVVRDHAINLIQAAEASESDAFFYHFLRDKVGIESEQLQPLIQEFALYRSRNQLEDLLEL